MIAVLWLLVLVVMVCSPTPTPPIDPTPAPLPTPTPNPQPTATPAPTATPMPTATPRPTPTPRPTATPEPTPTPTPVPTFGPFNITTADTVVQRDLEYGYRLDVPDDWAGVRRAKYDSPSPSLRIRVIPQVLPRGYDLQQFSQSIQANLPKSWWFEDITLFEIVAVDQQVTDDQLSLRIHYRIREEDYCVLDVVDLILISTTMTGQPEGLRLRARMCEGNLARRGEQRDAILDSFALTTQPVDYYSQHLDAAGVRVRADASVDPEALVSAGEIIALMLTGRPDIAECMPINALGFTVIPIDKAPIDIPEYADVERVSALTGNRRDTISGTRGHGGLFARPTTTGEEQLMGNWWPEHSFFRNRGRVAVHEFAHGIQNLCFTQEDHQQWIAFYEEAAAVDLYPDTHMMRNVGEFFAVFSEVYFEVDNLYDEDDYSREILKERFPEIYQALAAIYLGATLPEKYTELHPRPKE